MAHRHTERLIGWLVKALMAYGVLMTLSLVIGVVFAFFHEPSPD